MINFFRKIRQRLLTENKFSKYLLYAIGEIVLVVIGILIALSINNWNELKKDEIKERKLLNEMVEGLEFNVSNLKSILSDFKADDESSNLIITVIEHKRNYNDSLDYHFARALNAIPLYPITYVAYESMKNTGFDIVRNDQLKNEIINLFELTYSTAQLRQNNLPDLWDFIGKRFMNDPLGWSHKPFDFEDLVQDREFRSIINRMKSSRGYIGRAYVESLNESQRILQLIKDELDKSE
ncbi:MAG: hypothetical protein KAJ23_12515 [Maribacter sp.]|nr:hypothetical protein [Maribacter sp.]